MKKILIVIFSIILISGCSSKNNENVNDEYGDGVNFEEVMTSDKYIVLDVRTEEEYKDGHVVGALNIPYDTIDESVNLDKSKIILVYCKSGKRSKIAEEKLTNLGYEVIDLGAFDNIDLEKE